MWLCSQRATALFWIVVSFTSSLAKSKECANGLYWCQDRCGTDADTCCQTPDGQHNLCGPETICCGFGCCPNSSFTCNADFSCTGPDGVVIPLAPNPNPTTQPGLPTGNGEHPPATGETGSGASSQSSPTGDVVGIGTETVTLPVVASPTTLITLNSTFTLEHPTNSPPVQASPTWESVESGTATLSHLSGTTSLTPLESTSTPTRPGTPNSSPTTDLMTSVVVIDETQTITLPLATQETTITAEGQTITLLPGGPPTITISGGMQQPPATVTAQGTAEVAPVAIIDETQTLTLPLATQDLTVTTEGQIITLLSGGPPTIFISDGQQQPPVETATTMMQETATTTPVVVTVGSQTFTYSSVSQETTMTTEGHTVTLGPVVDPTITAETLSTQEPASTEGLDGTDGPLPTHTEWPQEAVLKPVETEVENPEPSDDDDDDDEDNGSAILPCKLWFFSICIKFDNINILGWEISLPPGIYPPGPPPFRNIKFPPSIEFQGELPPWPEFTVGPNHVPTFPSEPEPTKCETKTASLCSATTSYVVSTVKGAEQTVSSQVLPPTCGEVRGCLVADSTQEATATKTQECSTSTVTDVAVTCSGSGTTACSTKTEVIRTGCSVTPTTTTATCTPAQTGQGNARRQTDDNVCPMVETYIVWPRDGTNTDETDAIYTEMRKLLQDESKIRVSDTRSLGINFWRVPLELGQAKRIEEIPNVGAVDRECTTNCADPLTAGTNWRYQDEYVEEDINMANGRDQMVYLSQDPLGRFLDSNQYMFDSSAGEDIEVYMVDTGANLEHAEFTQGDNVASKTRFMFIENDHDGQRPEDDSSLPLGGRCPPNHVCKSHGTSMLTMVAGAKLGIAKKVKPVLMRVPRRYPQGGGASPQDYLKAVSEIDKEITEDSMKNGKTKVILSLSWYYDFPSYKSEVGETIAESGFDLWKLRLYKTLKSLIRKGVFVVTGTGNKGEVKGWPALYGAKPDTVDPKRRDDWLYIPELLVVGGADVRTGERWIQGGVDPGKGLPHIYGPADFLLSAQGDKQKWANENLATYKSTSGTSVATAYTAGLAAYFLKLDQIGRLGPDEKGNAPDMSPAGLKRYILNNGWARTTDSVTGDVVGIWNGAHVGAIKMHGVCPYERPNTVQQLGFQRRGNDEDPLTGQCVPGTSPTGSPTSESTLDPSETTIVQTTLQTSTKSPESTGFACTEETADQCAPTVICGAPRRNGCIDGKCVCILPDPPTSTADPTTHRTTNNDPQATRFTCTEETIDQCSPFFFCPSPLRRGCVDGNCTCIIPDQPASETTTQEPEPTKTPLSVGAQQCNNEDDFPDHGDVHGNDVFWSAISICLYDPLMMGPGDQWEGNGTDRFKGSEIHFRVEWIEDCVTEVDKQDLKDPLGDNGEDVGENSCLELFYEDWESCLNGGVGGWRDAGCLRYYMGAGHI